MNEYHCYFIFRNYACHTVSLSWYTKLFSLAIYSLEFWQLWHWAKQHALEPHEQVCAKPPVSRIREFKKKLLWLQECFALSLHEYWEGWRLDDCREISISVSTLWSSSSSCKTLRCFGAHYPAAAYFSIPPLSVLFYFVLWSAFHVPQNRNLL